MVTLDSNSSQSHAKLSLEVLTICFLQTCSELPFTLPGCPWRCGHPAHWWSHCWTIVLLSFRPRKVPSALYKQPFHPWQPKLPNNCLDPCYSKWSLGIRTWEVLKMRNLSFPPSYLSLLNQNRHFNKNSRWFVCFLQFEEGCSIPHFSPIPRGRETAQWESWSYAILEITVSL